MAEEYAFFRLIGQLMGQFDDEANDRLVVEGVKLAASSGCTTAQEGRAMGTALEAMQRVAESGTLPIDLVTYPDVLEVENISPTGWVLEHGMKFGTHHDAPVALPDSMRVLSATVTRTTRSGRVLGPGHRVPVETALKAMTLWPAWQHSWSSQTTR